MFMTFPFNEMIYVTVQRRKERVRLFKKKMQVKPKQVKLHLHTYTVKCLWQKD